MLYWTQEVRSLEFKDKLKELRRSRGLSQEKLASEIFVSRSAVAKWENGLGMPGRDSMEALIRFFGVDADYFVTEDAEELLVGKNRKIRQIKAIIGWTLAALMVLGIVLYNTGFRLSPDRFIEAKLGTALYRGSYVFYLGLPENDDGTSWFDTFWTVRRYGIFYHRTEGTVQRLEGADGHMIGQLYAFPDGGTTHYFFMSARRPIEPGVLEVLYRTDEITVNGQAVKLYRTSIFEMEEEIETMEICGEKVVFTTYAWQDRGE